MRIELAEFLTACDQAYHPGMHMLGQSWNGPGYHTRIPNGTWAHPTRETLDYALALLGSGQTAHIARAADILGAVLALQDSDPTSKTYGIWPWLGEEPLADMAPPDWNWADFCGARLAQILADYGALLPDALRAATEAALGHAAWSIFRRNVQPSYTNIAIMGAGVAAATGELLREPRLLDYGRTRLQRFVEHTSFHGGLNEYNSPTYTLVAIHECERILHLVRDEQVRALAETIRQIAWETIAGHFHPPTGQWAGPHSRTYGDWLGAEAAAYLSAQTGATIEPHPNAPSKGHGELSLIPPLACPAEYREKFQRTPHGLHTLSQRFICRDDEQQSTYGTTWMDEVACLGSVNWDSLWTQRRPLLAYWRTPDDPAAMLRLRCLHDGQDFATAGVRVAQLGPRALAIVGLLTNRGDFHLHLDRPADGRFPADDLRVRLELRATGAQARRLGENLFELAAGERRAVLHILPSQFAGAEVRWQLAEIEGGVALDGICARAPLMLDPAATSAGIALGMEIIGLNEAPSDPPRVSMQNGRIDARWGRLIEISAPVEGQAYPA